MIQGLSTRTRDRIGFLSGTALKILVAGLLIRIILALFLTYPFDVEHWAVIIQNTESGNGLFNLTGYFYTPVWGYILGFESLILNAFSSIGVFGERFTDMLSMEDLAFRFQTATVTSPSFNLVMKLPLMIVDVIVGYLIYRMIYDRTEDTKKATLAFGLWFLCPIVVYMSAIQGQFDCISALLILLCIFLLRDDRCFLAGVMFALASLIKFFPAFCILLLVVYILKKHEDDGKKFIKLAEAIAGATIATIIIFIPQIMDGTFVNSLSFIFGRAGESNIRSMLYIIAMAAITMLTMIMTARSMYHKSKEDAIESFPKYMLLILAVSTMISIGPQYCIVFIPFLAYYAAIRLDRSYILCILIITVTATITAFCNNSLSIFSATVEYFGIWDMQSLIDCMYSFENFFGIGIKDVITTITQFIQEIATFLIIGFLLIESYNGKFMQKTQNVLIRIRDKMGGRPHE